MKAHLPTLWTTVLLVLVVLALYHFMAGRKKH